MAAKKILVVDDDYAYVDFAEMILKQFGYEVVSTLDADKTLSSALKNRPDLILLDYSMDEMDGDEVIQALKGDPRTKTIPIILCSNTRSQGTIMQSIQDGAVGFVPKPLNVEVLLPMLKKVLGE